MICYVGLSVQIHGLNDNDPETIRSKVEALLREGLDPDYNGDIIVEIDEQAGTIT